MNLVKYIKHYPKIIPNVLIRKCPNCEKLFHAKLQRQITQYEDEYCNWIYACDECADEINYYWDEQWKEYNCERL